MVPGRRSCVTRLHGAHTHTYAEQGHTMTPRQRLIEPNDHDLRPYNPLVTLVPRCNRVLDYACVRVGRGYVAFPRPAPSLDTGETTASIGLLPCAEQQTPHPYLPLCDTNHRTVLKASPC